LFSWLHWRLCAVPASADLRALTAFTANTPFQYRLLIPALARGIEILAHHRIPLVPLYFTLSVVGVYALLLSFGALLRIFFPPQFAAPAALGILWPLVCDYCLVPLRFFYPSDIPSILFFVLGLIALLRRRTTWYYLIFILAVFNRETGCFLALAMLLLQWDSRRIGRLALHLAAQGVIWLGIKWLLGRWFAGNLGAGTFERHHWQSNVHFFWSIALHPGWKNLRFFLLLGGVWVLIPPGWKSLPQPLKRLLWIVVPFFLGMMFVGEILELRIFGELIPIVLVPALWGLQTVLRNPVAAQRLQRIFWPVLYVMAAISFTWLYWQGSEIIGRAALDSLAYFKAETPFQYRLLVPLMARGIKWLCPVPLDKIYLALTMAWTLVLLPAFARYLEMFVPRRTAVPAALFIMIPLLFNYVLLNTLYYPSDIASIVFFIWGLTLLFKGRLGWFYLIFVLATFNRETSCFLTPAMLFLYWGRLPVRRLRLHLMAQCFLWLGIKLLLRWWFAANPGAGSHENHFHENVLFFAALFGREDHFYGFYWARAMRRLLVFGGIWALIPLGWKNTPEPARRLMWIVPICFGGMIVVGVIYEVRIFGELIPILAVPALYGLGRCLAWQGLSSDFRGWTRIHGAWQTKREEA
jgi:hypothetical protein